MKKLAALCLCLLVCLCCLPSCGSSELKSIPPDGATINYNNTVSNNGYWLSSNSVCYLTTPVFHTYSYLIDQDSKTQIKSLGKSCRAIQRYGSKIYMLTAIDNTDEQNSICELMVYDVDKKETSILTSINNLNPCERFLVLDRTLYYSTYRWNDTAFISTLKKYSIDTQTHETVKDDIISFGVINGSIYYLAKENESVNVCKYSSDSAHIKQGEFILANDDIETLKQLSDASYTQKYIMFALSDYISESETSRIFKYSFEDNSLKVIEFNGYINNFISYDNRSYFTTHNEMSAVGKLYMIENDTEQITLLQTLNGAYISIFVCSDNGAYVYEDNGLNYYSEKANSSPIFIFKAN